MKDYHINILYSDDDGGYIADIPGLSYCSAFGNSPEEALHAVLIAKNLWLESSKMNETKIPKPRYRPAHYQLV
jgi:predicted RNase H-like HicB family nuclease